MGRRVSVRCPDHTGSNPEGLPPGAPTMVPDSYKVLFFDTETTGVDAQQADLVGISAAVQAHDQRATACLSADEVTQLNQLLARVMTSAPKAADR